MPASPAQAWVTLLTRPSYLPGVLILFHTLKKHRTRYPLLVLTTPSLPSSCVSLLKRESQHSNLLLIKQIEPLIPRENVHVIAERFTDTWTKLRVFQLTSYTKLIFLDADMMILRNPDDLFDTTLPGPDWIAANHACVCNIDGDNFAPEDWKPENCAYTPLTHPSALNRPTVVTAESIRTHQLLNSGMFIFTPSESLWESMLSFFNTTLLLSTFVFPDQDFLIEFFRGRWMSVGWQFNALKTMRYWHPNMWRDEEVRILHYIVDKPWNKRIGEDGVAGYKGNDGVTHAWWWEQYADWEKEKAEFGDEETLRIVGELVAKPGDSGIGDQGLKKKGADN